jgi:hypothetical protein
LLQENPGIALVEVTRRPEIDFYFVEWEAASGYRSASFDSRTNVIGDITHVYNCQRLAAEQRSC